MKFLSWLCKLGFHKDKYVLVSEEEDCQIMFTSGYYICERCKRKTGLIGTIAFKNTIILGEVKK
jgi:hypothetical protein